jgi:hypothetical protein
MKQIVVLVFALSSGLAIAQQNLSPQCSVLIEALNDAVAHQTSKDRRQRSLETRLGQLFNIGGSTAPPEYEADGRDTQATFAKAPGLDVSRLLEQALVLSGFPDTTSQARLLNQIFWQRESSSALAQQMWHAFRALIPEPGRLGALENVGISKKMGFSEFAEFVRFAGDATPALFATWLRDQLNGRGGQLAEVDNKKSIARALGVREKSTVLNEVSKPPASILVTHPQAQTLFATGIVDLAMRSTLRSKGYKSARATDEALALVLSNEKSIEEFVRETVARIQLLAADPRHTKQPLAADIVDALHHFREGKDADFLVQAVASRLLLPDRKELARNLLNQKALVRSYLEKNEEVLANRYAIGPGAGLSLIATWFGTVLLIQYPTGSPLEDFSSVAGLLFGGQGGAVLLQVLENRRGEASKDIRFADLEKKDRLKYSLLGKDFSLRQSLGVAPLALPTTRPAESEHDILLQQAGATPEGPTTEPPGPSEKE